MSNFSVPETPDINTEELIFKLRRKMGTWLEWGEACQQLQKARISPQDIFEQTGFEPIQQNQIIVAAQVFRSVEAGDASAPVIEHFTTRGSDVLYELRILSQQERASAAELAFNHGIDLEEAREVAKAMKDYGRLKALPDGYERSPGDAVAHQSWRLARQKEDLQARSRLIARGLKYASSDAARQALEKLLTDFTVVKSRPAPRLPIFRLDSEEEMPVIMPVVGADAFDESRLAGGAPERIGRGIRRCEVCRSWSVGDVARLAGAEEGGRCGCIAVQRSGLGGVCR